MKRKIIPFNFLAELDDSHMHHSIGEDVILFERQHINFISDYPFKVDVIIIFVCLRGSARGFINLKAYEMQSPCLAILLPNQILQHEFISDDFEGYLIVFSKDFAGTLLTQIRDKFPLFLAAINNPVLPLNSQLLSAAIVYYRIIKRVVDDAQNPYQLEIVKHTTMSLFYSFGSWLHNSPEQSQSKRKALVKNFFNLVQTHCKEERGLSFYADELNITPKHLSKVIKENSNMSAAAWIDNSVVLEAQAMLKSTNMTIQQISDELNFPSQSFFGKFFKRVTGMSPKEYREK
jgi:AraC-type DNA-binding domain-containing proteins